MNLLDENVLKDQILTAVKEEFKDGWAELNDELKVQVELIAEQSAKVALRAFKGEDVSSLQKHLTAQILNIAAIGSDIVAKRVMSVVQRVLEVASQVLVTMVKAAILAAF